MSARQSNMLDQRAEMFQRGHQNDSFFNMKALAPRPLSEATEIFDTDFEDDMSDTQDSPRLSINSAGQRSETTLSSFEELQTPRSTKHFQGFNFEIQSSKQVEGPRGPHLFRSSTDSSITMLQVQEEEFYLTMSPLTPRFPSRPETAFKVPPLPSYVPESEPRQHRPISTLTDAMIHLDKAEVARWSPRQVARWMHDAGFEPTIVEKFAENDISGAILITLKFEDLRELDIKSFGQRHRLWNEIHNLRGSVPSTPAPPTPIEDRAPSPEKKHRGASRDCGSDGEGQPKRSKSSKRKPKKPSHENLITPQESVSIVGIEQLMPKPHKCSKGENCSKWRKQQRLIAQFKNEHPVSPEGGTIWIAGDPGNPLTAEHMGPKPIVEDLRPVSEAVGSVVAPSVVASSDVLGPGLTPLPLQLHEESLRNIQTRDPQDNVKQFLTFQHMAMQPEEPATPPYEMFPPLSPNNSQPHHALRSLPRLAIPGQLPPRSASANAFVPYQMDRAEAMSPELRNATTSPTSVYRFGTPFSEMDVPVTAVPITPISRDVSQSVPPNMNYRHSPAPPSGRVGNAGPPISMNNTYHAQMRQSHRPAYPSLPRLDENKEMNTNLLPFSPVSQDPPMRPDDVSHQGWMKKRKTKMLRHEWHEHHFKLRGTQLAMHKDEASLEALEYIDVDDYAIACSNLASSKLNAAFKAMSISRNKNDKKDVSAFAFQLIPAPEKDKVGKLKRRESGVPSSSAASSSAAAGKTHHFAVKSREDRIDWMRELMLAKALKQKGDGYEIQVNGNMI